MKITWVINIKLFVYRNLIGIFLTLYDKIRSPKNFYISMIIGKYLKICGWKAQSLLNGDVLLYIQVYVQSKIEGNMQIGERIKKLSQPRYNTAKIL